MIPVLAATLPREARELEYAILAATERLFHLDPRRRAVAVFGDPPRCDRIRVDLSGAASTGATPPAITSGDGGEELHVTRFELLAEPVYQDGAALRLRVEADEARFRFAGPAPATGREAIRLLVPSAVARGRVRAGVARSDLEKMLFVQVARAARTRGVELKDISLELASAGPRSVAARVRLIAKKIVSAEAFLEAELRIDDRLDAVLTGVTARVSGFLSPLFRRATAQAGQELEGRRVPLGAASLGAARLRDLRLRVEDGIAVEAELGADPAEG